MILWLCGLGHVWKWTGFRAVVRKQTKKLEVSKCFFHPCCCIFWPFQKIRGTCVCVCLDYRVASKWAVSCLFDWLLLMSEEDLYMVLLFFLHHRNYRRSAASWKRAAHMLHCVRARVNPCLLLQTEQLPAGFGCGQNSRYAWQQPFSVAIHKLQKQRCRASDLLWL